jgi:hypothetical protein
VFVRSRGLREPTERNPFRTRYFFHALIHARRPHQLGVAPHALKNTIAGSLGRLRPHADANLPHHPLAHWAGRQMNDRHAAPSSCLPGPTPLQSPAASEIMLQREIWSMRHICRAPEMKKPHRRGRRPGFAAAILARQDHCAERGPPKLSLCERAQSSCGGGETHVREAPPHATGGRGLPIFAKKKPRTRRGQSSLCGDLGHREKLVSHRNAIAGFQPRLSRTQARPLEGNTLPFTWHAGQPIQSPIASMSRRNAPTAGSS